MVMCGKVTGFWVDGDKDDGDAEAGDLIDGDTEGVTTLVEARDECGDVGECGKVGDGE